MEEEKGNAKDKQTDGKDSLVIFHEGSHLNTENAGTGKDPDHGVHQYDPTASELSQCVGAISSDLQSSGGQQPVF